METQPTQAQIINRVYGVVNRSKAFILSTTIIAVVIGLAVYLSQPKIYKSSSLLIFQTQKISPSKMSPDSSGRLSDIVSTLSQVVKSRTNLEKIIVSKGLYKEDLVRLPMQDVVEGMRKKINIKTSRRGETFEIGYTGTDPRQVVEVTNELASAFIEENLKYREERASEVSNYAQEELDNAKAELDKKEEVTRDYKLKYYNEMPGQSANNMARLTALQNQYQGKQQSIQDFERTLVLISDQIAARKGVLRAVAYNNRPGEDIGTINQGMSELEQLKKLRETLEFHQGRYTDQHPKIKSLKRRIARLEQNMPTESSTASPNKQRAIVQDKVLFDLNLRQKGINLNIQKINAEKLQIQNQISLYEKWIAATPFREAEWSALTREYGQQKRHYDFLVSQNLQARSALNLELKQKGSQFKITDHAQIPTKPVEPDFLRIMAIALLAGCGIGGGLAFGLDFLNTSFRDPSSLEAAFGIEVICSVPNLPLKSEVLKKRIVTTMSTIFFGVCWCVVLVAIIYFYKQGRIII